MKIKYLEKSRNLKKYFVIASSLLVLSVAITVIRGISISKVDVEASTGGVIIVEAEVLSEYGKMAKIEPEVEVISNEPSYTVVQIPEHRDFKSYMPYTSITSWLQKDLQEVAYDGDYGIRMVDGRYCIAVGTACNAEVGDYVTLVLENGVEIDAIVGDIKSDEHTDESRLLTVANSCCSEFIVNTSVMDSVSKRNGSMSYCCEEWKSPVVEIRVYDYNYFTS